MGPMLWAGLVASGVAVATMAVFAARLTRRRSLGAASEEDFVPSTDPDDPWAAYRPRPFQEGERRRPRMWPAVAGVFGLVLVAGGVVGARQSTELTTVDALPTTKPYIVDVRPAAVPTAAPVAKPARVVTAKPKAVAPVAAPASKPKISTSGAGPKISGSMSCSGGTLRVSATVSGTNVKWYGLWVDGKSVRGGPMSGTGYTSRTTTFTKQATKGDHTAEATAEDKAGHTSRKFFTTRCS